MYTNVCKKKFILWRRGRLHKQGRPPRNRSSSFPQKIHHTPGERRPWVWLCNYTKSHGFFSEQATFSSHAHIHQFEIYFTFLFIIFLITFPLFSGRVLPCRRSIQRASSDREPSWPCLLLVCWQEQYFMIKPASYINYYYLWHPAHLVQACSMKQGLQCGLRFVLKVTLANESLQFSTLDPQV